MSNVETLSGLILAAIYGGITLLVVWIIWKTLKFIIVLLSIALEDKFPKISNWIYYHTLDNEEKESEDRHREFMKTHPINNQNY